MQTGLHGENCLSSFQLQSSKTSPSIADEREGIVSTYYSCTIADNAYLHNILFFKFLEPLRLYYHYFWIILTGATTRLLEFSQNSAVCLTSNKILTGKVDECQWKLYLSHLFHFTFLSLVTFFRSEFFGGSDGSEILQEFHFKFQPIPLTKPVSSAVFLITVAGFIPNFLNCL